MAKTMTKTLTLIPAALGCRAHSGWAALVALGGTAQSPVILERLRIELADPGVAGSKQPYHAAAEMDFKHAEKFIGRSINEARQLARQGLRAVAGRVREKGYEVVGCGILLASGRELPALAATLASHALIHTAEGELFREALAHASEQCHLPVTKVRERELFDHAVAGLRVPLGELQRRIAELGQTIGPPWRQDEKFASLAAWLALVA
jgi:hypothetical protein